MVEEKEEEVKLGKIEPLKRTEFSILPGILAMMGPGVVWASMAQGSGELIWWLYLTAKYTTPKIRYIIVVNSAAKETKIDEITPVKVYIEVIIVVPSMKNKMCKSGTPPTFVGSLFISISHSNLNISRFIYFYDFS
ncbi:MAG: hypothetical protein QW682_07030 [Nitrososphaerota archaeon]